MILLMKRAQPQADMTIAQLLETDPGTAAVLLRHGMACPGCAMAPFETLAEAAREYGEDLPVLLAALRELQRRPPRRCTAGRGSRTPSRPTRTSGKSLTVSPEAGP